MADSNQTDDVGTNTQTRNLLLKRNPHLRVNDTSSPSFGGLGTRQFLQKQLMTPGSATSASSFEGSYDGFSDAGTPSETVTKTQTLYVKSNESADDVSRSMKQPTKRLSSPSRETLARRFMDSSQHGMLQDEESKTQVDMRDGETDLPPSSMLSNIVVKTIPTISVGEGEGSMVPLSPRSSKMTRRVVASPRKNMRRVVIRRTGADGQMHEEVQYVEADGSIAQGGNFFNEEENVQTTMTRRISTPSKTVRRVVVRRTGEDGQVHEEVQYLDADGNVVETQNASSTVSTSSVSSTPGRTITRRIVTPGKLTRRTLRRTGADGQVHEIVQYLDVDGNVVKTEGDATDSVSSSSGTVLTRTVTPGKTIRRILVRRTGADGKMHEEVQFVDADGNVVSSSVKSSSDEDLSENTSANEGSAGQTKRVIRRMMVQKDGTSVPVEQCVDSNGNVIEEAAPLSTESFTDSNSGSNRRVTRRVIASPVRRTVVNKAGSVSGAESEDDVQYVESDGGDLASGGLTVDTHSGSGRRIITRRVVTPQRVVRRMVVHNGNAGSGAEADVEDLDDADFASSDESVDGSSRGSRRGSYNVSNRIVIPGETRRVVSRSVGSSNQQEGVKPKEKVVTSVTTTNQSEVISPTRVGAVVVTEPQEGETSSEPTEKINLSSSVVSDYFTKAEDEEKPSTTTTTTVEVCNNDVSAGEESSEIAPGAVSSVIAASTFADENMPMGEEVEATAPKEAATIVVDSAEPDAEDYSSHRDVVTPAVVAGVAGAAVIKAAGDHTEVIAPASNEPIDSTAIVKNAEKPHHTRRNSGGFWGFFGKSEDPKDSSKNVGDAVISEVTTATPVVENGEDEEKSIIPSPAVADIPETQNATATLSTMETFSKSPRDSKIQDATVLAASHIPTTSSGELPVEEEAAEPANVPAPNVPHSIVTTTETTTVTEEESESPSDVSNRKKARSIWRFWDSDKAKSPLNEDEKAKDEGNHAVTSAAAPVAVTGVTSEEQTSVSDIRQYWQQQDKQHPTNISYAVAEGATYGPESKLEAIPADKTFSPVARGQGAIVESPQEVDVKPINTTATGGIVVTEITQTTVEVEEEFDSGSVYHDAAETGTQSQQFVERVEGGEEKDTKPARAGGFWGFLTKKESTTKNVSWSEYDEDKLHPDATEAAVVAAASVPQIESVRRSIPSHGTPSNVAGPEASSGKPVRDSERRTTELIDGVEPDMELDEHYVQVASPRHGGHATIDEGQWDVEPCTLAWSKLRLYRHHWANASAQSDNSNVVLDDVSGSVKAGEFLVITGPSKDESLALLSCLAGYQDAMEGNVTVNGREWNEKMNRYIAYVMREDLFYETLTVHEHLVIQAHLRMRRTHTDEMCLERVERVIEDMGLSACRDKLIGGGISVRGISRGERKLLALATALLTNPSILLVEEPTDGLDTFSAEKVVAKLRWLAFEKGLTVAVTLHHPSSHFYGLFDVLYLVANASVIYDGKAADCVAYFSTIGYQCPEYMSPMDYFMLQMVVGDHESDDVGVARVEYLKREWAERNASVYADNSARAAAASEDVVVDDYDQKNRYYHMNCCGQLWLLWARHVRRLSRYGFVFWWHLLAALLIGVVFGLVYLQIDLNDQQGIQSFSGSFFYAIVIQMLFIAFRTFIFMPRETAIALRERQEYRGGWYHLLCWYFTKIVAELPALIILSIVLFVPMFLLVGIGHGFKVYVYMQIVMVLAGWAAIAWAFLALGVMRHVTLALIVYSVLLVLFVVFGGLFINFTDIPDWLVWLHYISPIKYAYAAMMNIFWKRVDSIDCDWTLEGCVALTGEGVLKYYSMEKRSALGDSLILLAICLVVFFVAFWFLLSLANKRASGLQWRYDWNFKGPLGRLQQRLMSITVNEKQGAASKGAHERSSSAAVERNNGVKGDNYYVHIETPRVGSHGVCDAPSITLGWSSLWLKAQTDKLNDQYVLSDASGSTKCGELMLITGPSDASNVALLESLGGLRNGLKGKLTLNGVVSTAPKLSKSAAYVARDDLFYETLTVEEHLVFQAKLAVGNASSDLTAERVEMVLDELELSSKRHLLIRYLSKVDTKLLAIATALLTNPSILLTEEPTCGMDFYSSQRIVLKLRQLARGGRTVVVTMDHPSSHLYALFDSLYLLAGGAAVYHGKVKEAVPYFASLGYQCPQYMSPVDYFIRQVTVEADGQTTLFKAAWSTRYSELCMTESNEQEEAQGGVVATRRRIGCCGQLSLLFRRHLLRLTRYQAVFGWHAFWMIVLGVIFGLIFLQLDLDDQQDIQNWAGAFFYIIVLQMLVIAYRTFVFLPREMSIAEREHRFGGYYMACWYVTKVFTELPAMLVLSILLFVPAYLLIGIGHGFKLYFYMQLVMWLSGWSAAGMATLLLGLFRRVRVALIIYMLLLILFVIFGGLLINVDDVPDYLIWLHYISPVKYGYEAMMKLFWGRIAFLACGGSDGSGSGSMFANVGDPTVGDDYAFSMSGSGSYEDDDGCIAHSGDEVLSHYSMDNSRNARDDTVILLELTVLYFFIGYAFLSLRWRRYKNRQQRHSATNAMDN
ncbi:Multidrug resistance protein ABC transporter [Phytophthora megakarya]|uniref:Multidrug resistance protein ABC transporter n=1 Tax=Phytophthora megakarya TaxID=4795 RepID=A0A225WJC4_9STRA|nr:Multidrug resistance protein ABC transporter [Phytophthora megakarya]